MRTDPFNEYGIKKSGDWNGARNGRPVRGGRSYAPVPQFTLVSLLHRILQGIGRLFIAARYALGHFRPISLPQWRLPWWKLGLAGLAIFILLKKDVQFSINMRAPGGAAPTAYGEEGIRKTTAGGGEADQMNVAQSLALQKRPETARPASIQDLDEARVQAYIRRFSEVAVSEMDKFGIPASVKMAQGILESRAGAGAEARELNNHFGRPLSGQRFANAWENWREHSLLLYHEYSPLFNGNMDYRKWAKGLKKAGYSSDRRYDRKLVELIERFDLERLDRARQ